VEAADASLQAAEESRNSVLVSLMAEVGLDYVTYRSLQQRIDLATQNLAAQQGTLDITRRLFDTGSRRSWTCSAPRSGATTAATIPPSSSRPHR